MENEVRAPFLHNGEVQKLIDSGADPYGDEVKSAIEFWGHEAGEFVPFQVASTDGWEITDNE